MKEYATIKTKRKLYLDVIKTISIYLVCIYHFNHFRVDFLELDGIGVYRNYFLKGLASTAVPLFIMVSGNLMLNSKKAFNLKNHIKKTLRLIIITFIWSVITLFIASIIQDRNYDFKGFLYGLSIWEPGAINHLWYLNALIGIYLIFPIIKDMYDKKDKKLLYYFLGMTFIFTFGNIFLNILYNIKEFLQGVNVRVDNGYNFFNNINIFRGIPAYTFVYFIIGGLIGEYIENNKDKLNTFVFVIILFISQTLLFLYAIIMTISNNATFDIVFGSYDTVMTLSMAICIYIICFKLEGIFNRFYKLFNLIGDNTLGIYILHPIIGWLLIDLYRSLNKSTNIFMNLAFAILILTISLLISLCIKKIRILKNLLKI